MSASIASSLVALRAADPAADRDVAPLCPDWQSVLAGIETDRAEALDRTVPRPRFEPGRRRTHRLRLVVAGALVAAAAISVGVITWPGSDQHPGSVAYGVTRESDGTVAVRQSPTQPFTSADLQARLRAAGVPAVVLTQSPPGACTQPLPTAIPSTGRIVSYPSYIDRTEGFLVHPASIPTGAVLVIALPAFATSGVSSAVTPAFAGLYVTLDPPTCIAQPSGAGATTAPSSAPSPTSSR